MNQRLYQTHRSELVFVPSALFNSIPPVPRSVDSSLLSRRTDTAATTCFTLIALHALTHHVARTHLIFLHSLNLRPSTLLFLRPSVSAGLSFSATLFLVASLCFNVNRLWDWCGRKKIAGDAGSELFRLNPVAGSPWQRVESTDGPYYYNLLTEVELAWQRDNVVDLSCKGDVVMLSLRHWANSQRRISLVTFVSAQLGTETLMIP